jgi:hypothetical protein
VPCTPEKPSWSMMGHVRRGRSRRSGASTIRSKEAERLVADDAFPTHATTRRSFPRFESYPRTQRSAGLRADLPFGGQRAYAGFKESVD